MVFFDAAEIRAIVEKLVAEVGLPTTWPSHRGRRDDAAGAGPGRFARPVVLTVESGGPRGPEAAPAAEPGRHRRRPRPAAALGPRPPRSRLRRRRRRTTTSRCRSRWRGRSTASAASAGSATGQRQRRLYHFRNRHGFTDAADAAFERLWTAEGLTWADIAAISQDAAGRPPAPSARAGSPGSGCRSSCRRSPGVIVPSGCRRRLGLLAVGRWLTADGHRGCPRSAVARAGLPPAVSLCRRDGVGRRRGAARPAWPARRSPAGAAGRQAWPRRGVCSGRTVRSCSGPRLGRRSRGRRRRGSSLRGRGALGRGPSDRWSPSSVDVGVGSLTAGALGRRRRRGGGRRCPTRSRGVDDTTSLDRGRQGVLLGADADDQQDRGRRGARPAGSRRPRCTDVATGGT